MTKLRESARGAMAGFYPSKLTDRLDYMHHIDNGSEEGRAFCGKDVHFEFAFVDVHHVRMALDQEMRILPCLRCVEMAEAKEEIGAAK